MATVYDVKTGQPVEIPDEQVPAALESGQYGLPKGQKVNLISPDGELYAFDPTEAVNASKSGWAVETGEQARKRQLEKEYGGTGGELASAGLGLLRGASAGLSDPILRALGVKAETLQGYSETNPWASGVPEVIGAAAPAVLSGGASLLERGGAEAAKAGVKAGIKSGVKSVASKAPSALIARGSRAIEKGLVKTFGNTVKGRMAAATLAQAGEGAVWGLGMEISQAAIHDEPLQAEQVLANVGIGALLGGGFGGGLKGMGELTGAGVSKGRAVFERLRQADPETGGPGLFARAAGKITGRDPTRLQTWIGSTDEGRYMREIVHRDANEVRSELAREAADAIDPAVKQFGNVTEYSRSFKPGEIEKAVEPGAMGDIAAQYADVVTGLKAIDGMLEEGAGTYGARADLKAVNRLAKNRTKQVEKILANADDPGFALGVSGEAMDKSSAAAMFNHMDQLKRDIQKYAKKIANKQMANSADVATFDFLKDQQEKIRKILERADLWGPMGDKQRIMNAGWVDFFSEEGYRMKARLERSLGQDIAKPFEKRYGSDPGAHKGFFDRLGDVENDLDEAHWMKRMEDRARVAEIHGEVYDLPASVMEDIRTIRAATEKWKGVVGKAKEIVGLQKEFQAIKAAGIGREAVIGMGAAGYMMGGPVGAAAGAILPAFLDPSKMIHTRAILDRLGGIQSMTSGIASKVKSGVEGFFTSTGNAARASTVPVAVHSFLPMEGKRDTKDPQADFRRVRDDIRAAVENPEVMLGRLESRLGELSQQLPGLADQLGMTAATAATHLLQTAPQPATPTGPLDDMRGREPPVPERDLEKWWSRYRIVNQPTLALDHLADGTLRREEAETLRAVYPRIFNQMVQGIMNEIASGKKTTYSQRVRLSYLTGQPMDASLQPQAIAAMATAGQQGTVGPIDPMAGNEGGKAKQPRKMGVKAKEALIGAHETNFQRVENEV